MNDMYRPTFLQLLLDRKRVARHLKLAALLAAVLLIGDLYRHHAVKLGDTAIIFVIVFLVSHLFSSYPKLNY